MTYAYSEDSLVERPAIHLFAEMGWQTVSALEELFGVGGTLGRDTKGKTVLDPRLRIALEQLNPSLSPETIPQAIDQLTRDCSALSLATANWGAYCFLKDGNPSLNLGCMRLYSRVPVPA